MRALFIGTGEIGVPALKLLHDRPEVDLTAVVTQPDRPAGRHRELKPSPIKLAALELGLTILQPEKIRNPEALDALDQYAPDLAVCMAYGQILSQKALEIPRLGCWNLHASLLPRHRGAAPIQAAILDGDPETGITVMQMDAGLDTGDILLKKSTPIAPSETAGQLHDRLAGIAAESLGATLDAFQAGTLHPTPQDESLATYAPKLSAQTAGLDWNRSASALEHQIRAMIPWPGSWSTLPLHGRSKKVKFQRARVEPGEGEPGTLLEANPDGLLIACGDAKALRVLELQIEGRKPMAAVDFLRGSPLKPGLRFVTPTDLS